VESKGSNCVTIPQSSRKSVSNGLFRGRRRSNVTLLGRRIRVDERRWFSGWFWLYIIVCLQVLSVVNFLDESLQLLIGHPFEEFFENKTVRDEHMFKFQPFQPLSYNLFYSHGRIVVHFYSLISRRYY